MQKGRAAESLWKYNRWKVAKKFNEENDVRKRCLRKNVMRTITQSQAVNINYPINYTKMNQRKSNRRYPPRTCKKSDCSKEFVPSNKRQVYCSVQHRIDHNNDVRDARAVPVLELQRKLEHNQKVLKKIKLSIERIGNKASFNIGLLGYENYYFGYSTDIEKIKFTAREIHWNYHYGLEVQEKSTGTFIIHYREKIEYGITTKISNN